MNHPLHMPSVLAGVAVVGCTMLLSASARQEPGAAVQGSAPIGRYQLAVGSNSDTVLVLDTAEGRVWRWQEPRESSTWKFQLMAKLPQD